MLLIKTILTALMILSNVPSSAVLLAELEEAKKHEVIEIEIDEVTDGEPDFIETTVR